jgi:tetratricopeptide (TPR) repeat protein
MAGVGKTALATHWAHRVTGQFPDGQLFADLRGFAARCPVPPGEILGRFLRALGVSPRDVPAAVEEQGALYRSLLTGKRMLLVLDNARSTEQVRPLLPGSSGCLVLITSRNRLSGLVALDGACRITLDPLAPEEAVALLVQVAGARRVAAEPDAADQICRQCGFLPLTLRMAAAQATARPGRGLGELADALARPGQQLDLGSDERTTVRAMLSWSYRALSPEAARLFGLLGLHPGSSVSAPCAAVLAGLPEPAARRQLQALASAHLLEQADGDHYRFPGLLRLYAAEHCGDVPGPRRADAVSRMLSWYLHTAAAASQILAPRPPPPLAPPPPGVQPLPLPSQAQALAWFEAERASILAATRQAADAGQHVLAWQLLVACWDFFYRRKHLADWLTLSTTGLASAQRIGDRYGEAWAWQSLGDAYRDLRQFSQAISHLEQALAIRRQIGDRPGEGWALANLGACYQDQQQYGNALSFYRQAAAAGRDAGDHWGVAISLTNAGEASRDLGWFRGALTACQRALAIHRQLGDQHSEAWTLNNLARIYHRQQRWTEALDHTRQALAIQQEIDDPWGQSITLTSLAEINDATGQPAQAIECYQQALNIQRDLADQPGQADTLTRLAGILQRTRQLDAARACLRQASELSDEPGER